MLPRMPFDYALTCVYRSILDVYRQSYWSWLTFESNWTSPGWVQNGTVTVTQGSNQVVFNGAASTAINAIGFVPSTVTQRQFRIGVGTIYNIWAWDGVNTATLDRNYQESSASGSAYTIFQCYYASPVQDFRSWASIRDMINYNDLWFNKDRSWGDLIDPQRTFYYIPTHVWFYQNDQNPNSATYGWPLFEIWGAPTYQLTYQLWGYRSGFTVSNGAEVPLVGPISSVDASINPRTALPQGIGEDVVMPKARQYAYGWAEANREKIDGRQNFLALKNGDEKEYLKQRAVYRKQDRALYDAFHTRFRRSRVFPGTEPTYNAISGVATPGAP
jgi:hypothetical protein